MGNKPCEQHHKYIWHNGALVADGKIKNVLLNTLNVIIFKKKHIPVYVIPIIINCYVELKFNPYSTV